ncbi:MAG: hypothetical protein JRI34_00960 [Deltaproteobacteria bacterium]|nr:hypothetical protein [Deltaproteobacteria bacterium]
MKEKIRAPYHASISKQRNLTAMTRFNEISYRHTQVGYTTLIILGLTAVVVLWAFKKQSPDPRTLLFVLVIILLIAVLFSAQTIEIKQGLLNVRMGLGLIQRKIRIDEIETCEAVKNKWYYGWGIHWTPHGWLYNVSGLKVIQITMKNGKQIRFGTDEPELLCQAIKRFI